MPAGLWDAAAGSLRPLDLAALREDVSHSWLADDGEVARHPSRGLTRPAPDKPGAYTWSYNFV